MKARLSLFYDRIGALTKLQRLIICLVTFALIIGGYYYFIFMPKQATLKKVQKIHDTQAKKLVSFRKQAAALSKYEKLMAEAQEKFNQAMLALPGRLYGMLAPGWQQEHWSLGSSRRRGYGQPEKWMPWVTTNHLFGVYGAEDFDPELFEMLCTRPE